MPRLGVILAELMMLVCLAATAFTHDTVQGVGVRKPDVSDWRAFHRQNDEYWARMVTATTGWRDAPVDHSQIRLTASEVRLQLDHRIAALARDALNTTHEQALQALREVRTVKELLWLLVLVGTFT